MKKTYSFNIEEKNYVFEIKKDDIDRPDEYDYDGYEKSLEKILEQVQKDFWTQYVDINRHQIIVGKNYLWISAALIGALSSIFIKFGNYSVLTTFSGVIFLIGFLLAVIGFGMSLYSLPAKKGYQMPHDGNWSNLSIEAYNKMTENKKRIYTSFLSDLITNTDNANSKNEKTNGARGNLFRKVYWVLFISFTLTLISSMTYSYTKYTEQKEHISSKEKNMSSSNSNSQDNDTKKVPEVEPPKQPETQGTRQRLVDHVEIEKNGSVINENTKK